MKLTKTLVVNTLAKLRDGLMLERDEQITENDQGCAVSIDALIYALENDDVSEFFVYAINYRAKSSLELQAFLDIESEKKVEELAKTIVNEKDFLSELGITE